MNPGECRAMKDNQNMFTESIWSIPIFTLIGTLFPVYMHNSGAGSRFVYSLLCMQTN